MFPDSKKILILDSVDSTNNYAMALIRKEKSTGVKAVFAMEQTHGKGRNGKHWKSNKGDNIILSIPRQMQWLTVSQQFQLSVAVALGCYDLIIKYVPENIFIKWPNDVFINDSKAGGILIENIIKGTLWQWTVIGIGLNINQEEFDDFNLKATSLKRCTKKTYHVLQLAEELHSFVLQRMEDLKSGNFLNMLKEYNHHLFARNKVVRLKKQNIVFETKIEGVSESGQLITKDILERRFNFDEVEFKGIVDGSQ
ncbi:MAG TPA: biotin--[acetyl-CoA-carboxylase] ligase [Hanamia sp.]|nr:biotin--[acetyl-CoA-carboxylase] ligase [Hanamia sp.]